MRLRLGLTLAALVGVALGIGLVLHFGLEQVGDAFLSAGWQGVLAISAVYFASLILCALAWRALLVKAPPNASLFLVWVRWLRDSTANLLAIVPAVGEAVAVRELTLHGTPLGTAVAMTVVDLTMELASQLLFTLLGVTILIAERPNEMTGWWLAAGLTICSAGIAGFVVAQHRGLFRFLETLPDRLGWTQAWGSLSETDGIHAGIKEIYRHRARVLANFALHVAGWIVGAGEAWIGLWFMDNPVSFADALVIESLVYALRTGAFIVPWAAGVQEGGYIVAGALFGLPPQLALSLSLLKRAREIVTGVPALIMWQCLEPWRLWRNRRRSPSTPTL
jgi:putative membrane protein